MVPDRLTVKLDWHGRVVDGPLWRRCKAREALWALEGCELQLLLPKDDMHYWKGLFQGGWGRLGQRKSCMQLMCVVCIAMRHEASSLGGRACKQSCCCTALDDPSPHACLP